jgi:hypothetical protein
MSASFKHRCPFCDRPAKLTKEHIWSKWTRRLLKYNQPKHQHARVEWSAESARVTYARTYGGDARNRSPKAACQDCNNGWMSELDDEAKPFLIPLIKGKAALLDVEAQQMVAAWIAMKTMAAEYFEPERIAVPLSERQYMRRHARTPDNWRIWIGHYERGGDWSGQWVHGTAGAGSERVPPRDSDRPNTQVTTFVIGNLYTNVISSEVPSIVEYARLGPAGRKLLAPIWPIQEAFVAWPTNALNDQDAEICATALFDELREKLGVAP